MEKIDIKELTSPVGFLMGKSPTIDINTLAEKLNELIEEVNEINKKANNW